MLLQQKLIGQEDYQVIDIILLDHQWNNWLQLISELFHKLEDMQTHNGNSRIQKKLKLQSPLKINETLYSTPLISYFMFSILVQDRIIQGPL